MQLEEFGKNVERAVDGKNAVDIFRNHPEGTFDVILMDIMMPEMNGYEAAKAIRAMNDRPDGKNSLLLQKYGSRCGHPFLCR